MRIPNPTIPPVAVMAGALLALAIVIFSGAAIWFNPEHAKDPSVGAGSSLWGTTDIAKPASLAAWPWPGIVPVNLGHGISKWETSSGDGTTALLFDFDSKANPNLRFEILDQDAIDATPYDNRAKYWNLGVGPAAKKINTEKHGVVLAAWNGLFFGYIEPGFGPDGIAFHVAPVVLNGKVHFENTNHRWGFGVKYTPTGPRWQVAHMPSHAWFAGLDWGGGGAQCLVNDGKPLKLQPFPKLGDKPIPQPVKSTPLDVGHIPGFDHMKTCRASLAWNQDNRHLYLLFIKENDTETASALALKYHQALGGGWTVPDLQRFWLAFQKENGTLTAINSDAGSVGQLAYRRRDGNYDLLPPEQAGVGNKKLTLSPDFNGAPTGGALMYFYVKETD